MAGPWLRFRGHLDNILNNMLIGAVNAFNDQTNKVLDPQILQYVEVPALARKFKTEGLGSVVVADAPRGRQPTTHRVPFRILVAKLHSHPASLDKPAQSSRHMRQPD